MLEFYTILARKIFFADFFGVGVGVGTGGINTPCHSVTYACYNVYAFKTHQCSINVHVDEIEMFCYCCSVGKPARHACDVRGSSDRQLRVHGIHSTCSKISSR